MNHDFEIHKPLSNVFRSPGQMIKTSLKFIITTISLMCCLLVNVSAEIRPANYEARGKRVVKMGWDDKRADHIRDNIEAIETNNPYFDGIRIRMWKDDIMMDNTSWTDSDVMLDELADIQWNRFDANFIKLYGGRTNLTSFFFNDTQWLKIIGNAKKVSSAIKMAGARGIMFDQEHYPKDDSFSPWTFNATYYPGMSFQEVCVKARQRGKAFIDALQFDQHAIDIIILHSLGDVWASIKENIDNLPGNHLALLPAFIEGMLDGANPATRVIDGAESITYYANDAQSFFNSYKHVGEAAENLLGQDYQAKWQSNGQVSQAMYLDYFYGIYTAKSGNNWPVDVIKDRIAHHVYHGLMATDEYLWIFGERDGSGNPNTAQWFTDPQDFIPPGSQKAMLTGVEAFRNNEALGYELSSYIRAGQWTKVSWSYQGGRVSFSINDRDSGFMEDTGGNLKDTTRAHMGYFNSSHPHYHGRIDNVEIYDTGDAISSGLIGHWKLDEGSGTQVSDSSGNNFTGTLEGPDWTTGINGQDSALFFDGNSDRVILPEIDETVTDEMTMSAWIRPDNPGSRVAQTVVGTAGFNGMIADYKLYSFYQAPSYKMGWDHDAMEKVTSPEITITSPRNDSVVTSPLNIETFISDSTEVAKVEFYVNSQFIGEDTTAPYSYSLGNLQEGSYLLVVRVIKTDGAHNTSAPVIVDSSGETETGHTPAATSGLIVQ